MSNIDQIKSLRDKTGVSIMQCKKALEESGGDIEKALILLRKSGAARAEKRKDHDFGSGVVSSYVHAGGKVGSIVEVNCETDFVAKNEEFQAFAYEIAMQVAAMNPLYLKDEDIPGPEMKRAEEVLGGEIEGKTEELKKTILEGKIKAYFKDKVLLNQSYIKDPEKTIQDFLNEIIQKFGENIQITRFERFGVLE